MGRRPGFEIRPGVPDRLGRDAANIAIVLEQLVAGEPGFDPDPQEVLIDADNGRFGKPGLPSSLGFLATAEAQAGGADPGRQPNGLVIAMTLPLAQLDGSGPAA